MKIYFWLILASLQQFLFHLLQPFFLFLVNQLKLLFSSILQVLFEVLILFDFSLLYVLLDCFAVVLSLILKNSLLGGLISFLVFYLCREINGFRVELSNCLWELRAFFLELISEDDRLACFSLFRS